MHRVDDTKITRPLAHCSTNNGILAIARVGSSIDWTGGSILRYRHLIFDFGVIFFHAFEKRVQKDVKNSLTPWVYLKIKKETRAPNDLERERGEGTNVANSGA